MNDRVTALVPVDLLEARVQEHRQTEAILTMRIVRYREVLEENGIDPPDDTDDELLALWREARAVVSTASDFVAHLGTAKEWLR